MTTLSTLNVLCTSPYLPNRLGALFYFPPRRTHMLGLVVFAGSLRSWLYRTGTSRPSRALHGARGAPLDRREASARIRCAARGLASMLAPDITHG
jgi:hypothetical protein